jgi:hypothetical protein
LQGIFWCLCGINGTRQEVLSWILHHGINHNQQAEEKSSAPLDGGEWAIKYWVWSAFSSLKSGVWKIPT